MATHGGLLSFIHTRQMELKLLVPNQPSHIDIHVIEKKVSGFSQSQEMLSNGCRFWISRLPQTQMRPLLHARPFDILSMPLRLSRDEIEDYRIGIGTEPKNLILCSTPDETEDAHFILFCLSLEVMTHTRALLMINPDLGHQMFDIPAFYGDDFPAGLLDDYPGSVYEIAHEGEEGDLIQEWLVDAHWMRSWLNHTHQKQNKSNSPQTERFASLDYE